MKLIKVKNYEEMTEVLLKLFVEQIEKNRTVCCPLQQDTHRKGFWTDWQKESTRDWM